MNMITKEMKRFKEDYKKNMDKYKAKDEEKARLREVKAAEQAKIIEVNQEQAMAKPTEQEKLAKTGNFILKGIAFWYLIPVFLVIAIAGVFFVFWVWDMTLGRLF